MLTVYNFMIFQQNETGFHNGKHFNMSNNTGPRWYANIHVMCQIKPRRYVHSTE